MLFAPVSMSARAAIACATLHLSCGSAEPPRCGTWATDAAAPCSIATALPPDAADPVQGVYWAGLAAQRAGMTAKRTAGHEMAADYPDRFYGQLALKELVARSQAGRRQSDGSHARSAEAFAAQPIVGAVREIARDAPWRTGIQFYRELAQSADTLEEHQMVADLAREIGRRDLAVNVAEAERTGTTNSSSGFPVLPLPEPNSLVHAIARRKAKFAQNAISHAGARGLMRLMPGTAREEAERRA